MFGSISLFFPCQFVEVFLSSWMMPSSPVWGKGTSQTPLEILSWRWVRQPVWARKPGRSVAGVVAELLGQEQRGAGSSLALPPAGSRGSAPRNPSAELSSSAGSAPARVAGGHLFPADLLGEGSRRKQSAVTSALPGSPFPTEYQN